MASQNPTLDPANMIYPLKDGGTVWPRDKGFTKVIGDIKTPKPEAGENHLIGFQNPDTSEQLVLRGETEKQGDRPLYIILDESSPGAKEILALKK